MVAVEKICIWECAYTGLVWTNVRKYVGIKYMTQ